jgi:hypothetical protein
VDHSKQVWCRTVPARYSWAREEAAGHGAVDAGHGALPLAKGHCDSQPGRGLAAPWETHSEEEDGGTILACPMQEQRVWEICCGLCMVGNSGEAG